MRILHINCNYLNSTLHQLMIERLDALGYDNQVYVPTYDAGTAVIKPNANVCVSECFKKWDRLVFDYKQAKILKDIESRFDIASFDCIHAYTLFTDGNCARGLSEKHGIPYVVAIRNTDVNSFFAKMIHLRRRGIRNMLGAKKVFFLSEAYRKQVFGQYVPAAYKEVLHSRTAIIPNGIDAFWLNNAPEKKTIDGKTVRLVYAGRIDKNKNVGIIQSAMSYLAGKGFESTLDLAGKIADRAEFDKIMSNQSTRYLGVKTKEELLEVYRANDIFVMPSHKESFGLVYAEAMSQGLPVIYTRGQGFDGQFEDGYVGRKVDDRSFEVIGSAIASIIDDYQAISSRCVGAAKKFDWNNICQEYAKIYEQIYASRS